MVSKGVGSIFRRKDGKYFVYMPKNMVEDTAFPFELNSSIKVSVHFEQEKKKIIIEELKR
jgi:hypothetical protein